MFFLVVAPFRSLRVSLSSRAELFIFLPLLSLYPSVLWLALRAEPRPWRRGKEGEMKDSYGHERGRGRSPPERLN